MLHASGRFPLTLVNIAVDNYEWNCNVSLMRSPRRRSHLVAATAGVLTLALASVPSLASASEAPPLEAVQAYEAIENLDHGLVYEPVDASVNHRVGEPIILSPNASVEVASDPTEGVVISDVAGDVLNVTIPFADEAGDAVQLDNGALVFPGEASSSTVIVGDKGVQMLTTIVDDTAPTRYAYEVDLAEGEKLELVDGGAQVVSADGTVITAVPQAWAKDASGADVPTHFEVDGNNLVQVVSHTDEAVAYPVVADPIWVAPWVWRCLLGIGLNAADITTGFATGFWGPVAKLAWACIRGK